MADLESAADAAVIKVTEFTSDVEKAKQAFSTAEEQVARVAAQVEADSAALAQGVSAFLEKVQSERTRLSEESQQALQALAELQQGVGGAAAEGQSELQGATQEVSALGDQVEAAEPQVAGMAEQVETTARTLATRAGEIETALEKALSEAREFVGVDAVEALHSLREQIEERTEAVKKELTDGYQSALENVTRDWQAQLLEVEQTVAKAFADAGEHAALVVDDALQECVNGHEDAVEEVAQTVATLESALGKLKSAVENSDGEVDQAKSGLRDGMGETSARLNSALAALQSVKELLASFTFVEM